MFDSVLTIAFRNLMQGGKLFIWVCESPTAFTAALEELQADRHIEIVHNGASTVRREK